MLEVNFRTRTRTDAVSLRGFYFVVVSLIMNQVFPDKVIIFLTGPGRIGSDQTGLDLLG